MKRTLSLLLIYFCFSNFFTSCSKKEDKEDKALPLRNIDKFCVENGPSASKTRIRYKEASPFQSCESEEQTAICKENKKLSEFSGTYSFESCFAGCGPLKSGERITRIRYKEKTPLGKCENQEQEAFCADNGKLSFFTGAYSEEKCFPGCTTLRHGELATNLTKYKAPSVSNISSCEKQETFCEKGILVPENKNFTHDYCSTFPLFELNLEEEDLAQIHKYRQEALNSKAKKKMLFAAQKKYVNASLTYNGKAFPVEVRLKGDYLDHFKSDKYMSFRVKIGSDNAFLGMRKFSIQRTVTRSLLEGLRHRVLKHYGILALKYFYVSYRLNGEDLGIMAIEEHFSHELLESQQARESTILAVNEDYFYGTGKSHVYYTPLRSFKEKKTRKNPVLNSLYKESLSYFRGFKERHIKAETLFDMEKVAVFTVITNLFRGVHSLGWQNLRFYFNPFTQKFEPIAYDATNWVSFGTPALFNPNSSDLFLKTYKKFAHELQETILDGRFSNLLEQERGALFKGAQGKAIHLLKKKEDPYIKNISTHRMNVLISDHIPQKNQDPYFIYSPEVLPQHKKNNNYLISYYYEEDGKAYLEFINRVYDPVQLNFVKLIKKNGTTQIFDGEVSIQPGLFSKDRFRLEVPLYKEIEDYYLITASNNYQPSQTHSFKALYQAPVATEKKHNSRVLETFLEKYTFFKKKNFDTVELPKGVYTFIAPLFIPEGINLSIQAGSILSFSKKSSLNIMKGSFTAKGHSDNKIIFKATLPEDGWKGIKIVASKKSVTIEHSLIKDIIFPKKKGLGITGAVSIYEGTISVSNTKLENIKAEDAINLVKSQFNITSLQMSKTSSDGLDIDWSQGIIKESHFDQIEGDAIDISGTELFAENIFCTQIKEKAVSVSEKSNFKGISFFIEEAQTAIASKDSSKATLENSRVKNISGTAFSAYIKKAEYGPSSLILRNVKTESIKKMSKICDTCLLDIFL